MLAPHPRLPRKVRLADITVRDGFRHRENWVPTAGKVSKLLGIHPTARTLGPPAVIWWSPHPYALYSSVTLLGSCPSNNIKERQGMDGRPSFFCRAAKGSSTSARKSRPSANSLA